MRETALVAVIAGIVGHISYAVSAKPHILLFVVDDVGWADTTINAKLGTKSDIPTPSLNNLASTGMLLASHYVQPVCSPTRTALQTGRYPHTIGTQHMQTIKPGASPHMPRNKMTIAEALKAAGYKTAMIGKWHCGYASWVDTPLFRGYDSYLGYLQGQTDYYNKTIVGGFDFWNDTAVGREYVGEYSLDQYMDRAIAVIDDYTTTHQHSSEIAAEPLFLFFSHQTVHIPLESAHNSAIDQRCTDISDHTRKIYCSMVVELDDATDRLVNHLKTSGLWSNMLMLGTTDNGGMVRFEVMPDGLPNWPASAGTNEPLRGSKTTLFEGGVRGTGFICGGALPTMLSGTVYHGLTHVVDFTKTIATAAGITWELGAYDIPGAAQGSSENRTVVPINIVEGGKNYTAIRFDNWKLIVGGATTPVTVLPNGDKANGWFKGGLYPAAEMPPVGENPSMYLFDVFSDPTEHHDLSEERPDIVAHGKALIEDIIKHEYEEPQNNAPAAAALPALHSGVWSPFHETVPCAEGLEKLCGQLRGNGASCRKCLVNNELGLHKAGCTLVSESQTAFCEI